MGGIERLLCWSEDFQRLDIGLYPMADTPWTAGKSALKSIQYMAVGAPFVVSPVGAAAVVGEAGVTHLEARSPGEWRAGLEDLLADPGLRARMAPPAATTQCGATTSRMPPTGWRR